MDVWAACIGVLIGLVGAGVLGIKGKGRKFQKLGMAVFGILAAACVGYLVLTLLLLGGIS